MFYSKWELENWWKCSWTQGELVKLHTDRNLQTSLFLLKLNWRTCLWIQIYTPHIYNCIIFYYHSLLLYILLSIVTNTFKLPLNKGEHPLRKTSVIMLHLCVICNLASQVCINSHDSKLQVWKTILSIVLLCKMTQYVKVIHDVSACLCFISVVIMLFA